MRIHHIGYAVRKMDKAIEAFESLGYTCSGEFVYDGERKVNIQLMVNGEYEIELISPNAQAETCAISNILRKVGNSPYHICYEADNIGKELKELTSKGFKIIAEPKEAPALENRKVAFLYNNYVGIVEIVDSAL